VTGLTSPTYTLSTDTAPDVNGKQHAITALGGTQTGVESHSVAAPFTITFVKPKVFKALGKANPSTGLINNVPRNVYKIIGRKGMLPLAGQPHQNALFSLSMEVPAGADLADPEEINALCSMFFGALWANADGVATTLRTGIMG